MLLRISLIVAILAGAAALYFNHFEVAKKIDTLTTNLATEENARKTAEDAQRKAQTEAKKAKAESTKATLALNETTASLQEKTARLNQQEKRANDLADRLDTATKERNDARQALAVFEAAGVKPDQLKKLRETLVQTTTERDAFIAENKILLMNNNQLQNELSRYIGDREVEVKLPAGLKGKVLAVDPKYDFVVLDIGGNQGVLENGRMLVNRDGKLVAKVQITKVEPNRSIANILPDWKQAEVMEGDQVLY